MDGPAGVSEVLFDTYLTQRFIIRWRVWLTDRLTGDWLTGRAYYRGRFTEPTIDNPDQRIQHAAIGGTPAQAVVPNVDGTLSPPARLGPSKSRSIRHDRQVS